MFKRCSQESWALTCPDPMRNPIHATAEGEAVINPEIQALEVFGRKAHSPEREESELHVISLLSSLCKADLQDPSWMAVERAPH